MEDLVVVEQIIVLVLVSFYTAFTCANIGIVGWSGMDCLHRWVRSFKYRKGVSLALSQPVSGRVDKIIPSMV